MKRITLLTISLAALALAPRLQGTPDVAATKDDILIVDIDGDGKPESGDTIQYTVTITNRGDMDATGMSFSDALDTNTTFVAGSIHTTPLALDDQYDVIGNVQIDLPAPGVLANDSDPDGVGPALTVLSHQNPSANGGEVAVNGDGSFNYTPPAGFEGTDTFTYTIEDGEGFEDTATVSLTVSDVIWFVDAAAGPGGDGRLSSPFNALTGPGSFATGAADEPGDSIFLYSGSYNGGLALMTGQKLVGQGAGAPLSTIIAVIPPTGSASLPPTGGPRPVLTSAANNLTLALDNLVQGLDLVSTANTALLGSTVGNLSLAHLSISNGAGVAVDLSNGTLDASLTSVSASGGNNGIKLSNMTGSFTVTGTGPAGSGGTIQNTTGADGSSNGNGLHLSSVSNVTLTSMNINNHPNFAIRGIDVNGFALVNSTVNGVNGTSAAADEGSIRFSGLTGAATIDGCSISGGFEDNVRIVNNSGTLDRLTLMNTTIGANSFSFGNDGVLVEATSSATVNVTVTNCSFTSARGDLLQLNAANNGIMDWVVVDNTFANNHGNIVSGGGGATFSGGGAGSAVAVTYRIAGNTFRDARGIALNVSKGTGGGSFIGTISDNTIGVSGLADSGSSQASGIRVRSSGSGVHTARIENNTIYQYNLMGIYLIANDGANDINATILNNTVVQPGLFALNGLHLNIGGASGDSGTTCADIRDNNLVGSGSQFGDPDFNLRQRFGTTIRLPGYAGANNDTAAVVALVQSNNTGTPDGIATVSGGGGGFVGGSPCVQPLLAAVEVVEPMRDINPSRSWPHSLADPVPGVAAPTSEASDSDAVLTEAKLSSIVVAARERWLAARLSEEQQAALDKVTFGLADLSGRHLGAATAGQVMFDRRGADRGWFIDPTPMDESEFVNQVSNTRLKPGPQGASAGRFDLLTAVMHELGHVVGLTDSYEVQARESLMYGFLPMGERRLPTFDLAMGVEPGDESDTHYIGAPITIGSLPPGKSITITFEAAINPPSPSGLCQVANQGVVSGSNFADVLTDDPDTGAPADATLTPVNQPDLPVITPVPAGVIASSTGNQASGPAGFASYAWTIGNGTISSPDNLQTILYTAGASGDVTLGLTVFNAAGCGTNNSIQVPIVIPEPPPPGCSFASNYVASTTFTDGLGSTTVGLAFDGTNYWSCSGGGSSGDRLARYDASGALLATYAPGLDFRSVFTAVDGTVLARAYNSPIIYRQVSPGVFTNFGVTLTGGTLDSQSSVVFNGDRTEYIAMSAGMVSRWDTSGSYLGSVSLQGFGSVSGESGALQNRGIAAMGSFWLTYNGSGILSVWDTSGNRVAQTTLSGAGSGTTASGLSLSFCNGKAWIVDDSGGTWRGYEVCGPVRVAILAAESDDGWNQDVRDKILGEGSILEVDLIRITIGDPVPTLAELSRYRALLVYSERGFNDGVAIGDVLADYVDQGGGVVMATFAFHDSGSLAIQGRLKTGSYLPFSTATQASPDGLTLVKNLPSHPLLDGVSSLDGGSSFHNNPISITNGATLVASWSNGQPLVGALHAGPGRVVGLNFFPPSSDARSDFWVAGTDGARLMANALLWSGQAAPTILTAPVDQVGIVGGTVSFSVSAAGSAPLSYQWQKDGANLSGASTSNLTFTVQADSAGQYGVVVSNPYGVAVSTNATLTLLTSTNLVLGVADSGWYDWTGSHSSGNQNYVAGNWSSRYSRNWFVFDIPALSAPVTRAELRVGTYDIVSSTGSETYQLREVTTPTATVQAGGSGLTNIYNDLGDGPVYATRTFVTGEANRDVSILLNQTLRNAVTAAAGGPFAFGGELATLDADVATLEYLFGGSPSSGGGVLELVLTVGTGDLPVAGYFTDNDPTETGLEAPILNAGFAPLHIGDISTQDLSGLRLLLINEESNSTVSPGLLSRLPDIEAWVRAGGRLIIHDRIAGNISPNPLLVGTPGLGTVRQTTANLDRVEPATTLVTAGPFGIVDDTTLDGGSSSAHGYLPAAALPDGARAILSIAPDQIACFSYPLGAGFVYYSTIPLDAYLGGGSGIAANLTSIYTPNVISYTHELHPRLRFLTPAPAVGGLLPLYLENLDGTPVAPDRVPQIRLYGTPNITTPIGSWNLLSNPLVLTNGLLRVDGVSVTNSGRFFRAVEVP